MSTSESAPLEPEDVKMLRSLKGESFGFNIKLPSGRLMSGEEAARALLRIEETDTVFHSMCDQPCGPECILPDSKAIVDRVFQEMGIETSVKEVLAEAESQKNLQEPCETGGCADCQPVKSPISEPWHYRDRQVRPSWGVLFLFVGLAIFVGWSIGWAGAGLGWW